MNDYHQADKRGEQTIEMVAKNADTVGKKMPVNEKTKNPLTENTNPKFVNGFVEGAFFVIGDCFRPAFGIHYYPQLRIDSNLTKVWRDSAAQKYGFNNSEEMKKALLSQRVVLSKNTDWQEVQSHTHYVSAWAQNANPVYDFHEGDTFHSCDGSITVQIEKVLGQSLIINVYHGKKESIKKTITQNQFADYLIRGDSE